MREADGKDVEADYKGRQARCELVGYDEQYTENQNKGSKDLREQVHAIAADGRGRGEDSQFQALVFSLCPMG